MGGLREWTRDEVATRILAGDILIILNNRVVRIPPLFLSSHPGGDLAILHFVGRDATDEVEAFHWAETLKRMNGFAVGTVRVGEEGWEPLLPPIASGFELKRVSGGVGMGASGKKVQWVNEARAVRSMEDSEISPSSQVLLVDRGTLEKELSLDMDTLSPPPTTLSPKIQARHSKAYKELHKRVKEAGLYKTPYLTGYGPEVARYVSFAVISAYAYAHGWFVTSAIFLGFLWHQLVFTVHDLGHMGVTHNWTLDRLIAIFIADFVGGLSVGWWVDNHNVHHLVTNHPSHDPDIEHLPFFAISPSFLSSLYSTYYKRLMPLDLPARYLLRIQHKLFYIIMSLARFNLYFLSYSFLSKAIRRPPKERGGRWGYALEVVGIVCFWTWYIRVLRGCGSWRMGLVYLLVSNIVPSPLHVQIVLSHFSRSTVDLGPTESFPHRQLRTTTDVICPPSLAFLHGGLHLQVTHHLFPRLPRHNLKKASALVKEYAKEEGLEYAEFGWVEGNKEVRGVLEGVAGLAGLVGQVGVVGMVAEAHVQEAMKIHIHDGGGGGEVESESKRG